jgi:glycosyltransferase involved in cell wall biosynthesis
VPVFYELYEELKSEGVHIHLDVFSSFSIYGWGARDEPYKAIFQMCHDHPAITYHGAKPNSVVRDALEKAHIFAFPSIWPETSCIAMIEAMASATMVVHPNLAALVETSGGNTRMYPFIVDRDDHAAVFYDHLATAILDYRDGRAGWEMQRSQATGEKHHVKSYVDQWVTLLDKLK